MNNEDENPYMTDTGILICDLYLLSYEGLKVIFQVCKTTPKTVCLIELATKKYKDGYTLTKKYRPSKQPLVVVKDNVFSRSAYEVSAMRIDKKLPIRIDLRSKLFWEATKYTRYPKRGIFFAVPFLNHRNTYWKKPVELSKIKKKEAEEKVVLA